MAGRRVDLRQVGRRSLECLTKVGALETWLVSATVDTALADIDVRYGILGYENQTTGLGNPARTLTIYSNASLGFYNTVNPLENHNT